MPRIDQMNLETLREVLEDLPFYVITINRDHRIQWINRIQELPVERVIGAPVEAFIHESSRELLVESLDRAFETGELQQYESLGHGPGEREDEQNTWYETLVLPIPPREGVEARAVLAVAEIGKRKAAELALRESEERFRLLAESSPDLICVVDENLELLYANQHPSETRTEAVEQGRRRTIVEDIFEADQSLARHALQHTLDTQEMSTYRCRSASGARVYSVRVVPYPASRDQRCVLQIVSDVTEQWEAEQARSELEAKLQQAQKMEVLGQLAGGIAHDFNNLLAIMQTSLAGAFRREATNEPVRRELEYIEYAAERAAELTRSLLAIGRRQTVASEPFELRAFLRASLVLLRRVIPESIEIRADYGNADLPIVADRNQLEQAMLNLIVNARDAIKSNGSIDIALRRVGDGHREVAEIEIRDDGCGMDGETMARAFEPFFTTKPSGSGSGLGLAMVHGLIAQNHGEIALHSALNEGTAITLRFPLVDGDREPSRPPDKIGESTFPAPGQATVLLAEDDEFLRPLLVRLFEEEGFRVHAAADGEEAIAIHNSRHAEIDIAVLDVVMPKVSGSEACVAMRRATPELPCILTSGYAADTISSDFLKDNDLELLTKPYPPATLLAMVRSMLGRNRR